MRHIAPFQLQFGVFLRCAQWQGTSGYMQTLRDLVYSVTEYDAITRNRRKVTELTSETAMNTLFL